MSLGILIIFVLSFSPVALNTLCILMAPKVPSPLLTSPRPSDLSALAGSQIRLQTWHVWGEHLIHVPQSHSDLFLLLACFSPSQSKGIDSTSSLGHHGPTWVLSGSYIGSTFKNMSWICFSPPLLLTPWFKPPSPVIWTTLTPWLVSLLPLYASYYLFFRIVARVNFSKPSVDHATCPLQNPVGASYLYTEYNLCSITMACGPYMIQCISPSALPPSTLPFSHSNPVFMMFLHAVPSLSLGPLNLLFFHFIQMSVQMSVPQRNLPSLPFYINSGIRQSLGK